MKAISKHPKSPGLSPAERARTEALRDRLVRELTPGWRQLQAAGSAICDTARRLMPTREAILEFAVAELLKPAGEHEAYRARQRDRGRARQRERRAEVAARNAPLLDFVNKARARDPRASRRAIATAWLRQRRQSATPNAISAMANRILRLERPAKK